MLFCSVPNCKSPNFSKDKLTGKGFCRSHQTKRTDFDRRSIIQKAIAKQNSISTKVRSLNNLSVNKDLVDSKIELELFFKLAAKELANNPICQECGEYIPKTIRTVKAGKWVEIDNYRNCTAHIFPKAIFESCASNPNNRLFLCCKNGCHEKSHRLDTFSKMKIFPEAVMKFKLFEDEITERHKLLSSFKKYADEIN